MLATGSGELLVSNAVSGPSWNTGGLFRSVDRAQTFTKVCCDNFPMYARTIKADRVRTGVLYARDLATGGLYRSTNGGATWNQHLLYIAITDLDVSADGAQLYAATEDEGVKAITLSDLASCTYTVSTTRVEINEGAAEFVVTVTTAPECAWSTYVHPPEPTVGMIGSRNYLGGAVGSGNLVVWVAANSSSSARAGAIIVAGRRVDVLQYGASGCTFTLASAGQSVSSQGGTGSVSVSTSTSTCRWTSTSDAAWLRVTSGATGTGQGSAAFIADSNPATSARSAKLYIGGQQFTVTQAGMSVTLSASPSTLFFGASKAAGSSTLAGVTATQEIAVNFSSTPGAWTTSVNQPWVQITNGSGSENGRFTVSITNPNDVIGAQTALTATITVTAASASNSPLAVPVTLTVKLPTQTAAPFGTFDTPPDGAVGLQGSIGLTGWALDDLAIKRVEIWRNCLEAIDRSSGACASPAAGLPANYVFLGKAFLLAGARPDVEAANPTYPFAYRAGWGFMLLTNALPHQILNTPEGGQGGYVLSAFAIDEENRAALLGTKTISVDNDHATAPFGAIDTPGQGATIPEASAPYNNVNAYPAFGWAMTQSGKCIDTTSTSVYKVFIDGVQRALTPGTNWVAGLNRSDLAAAYPGLCITALIENRFKGFDP